MKQLVLLCLLFVVASPIFAQTHETQFKLDQREVMTIRLQVNGRTGVFVIDTLCAANVISSEFAGIPAKKVPVSNYVPQALDKPAEFMARIQISNGTWHGQRMVVLTREQIHDGYKTKVDGVLGRDFLRQFHTITFDYRNRVLKLFE